MRLSAKVAYLMGYKVASSHRLTRGNGLLIATAECAAHK